MFSIKAMKKAMIDCNVSAKELADKLHISVSTLSRKINNCGNFSRSQIEILIAVFGYETAKSFLFSDLVA